MSDVHIHEWSPDAEAGGGIYACSCGARGRRDIRTGAIRVPARPIRAPQAPVSRWTRGYVSDDFLPNGERRVREWDK